MKIYVTSRFKGADKESVEALCQAVGAAGLEDFSFIRDIENYKKVFTDPKELWQRSKEEIKKCDAVLVDVSDSPSGGRVIEVGIAYGLGIPVYVAVKKGLAYKEIYDGVSKAVIEYEELNDITDALKNLTG